MFNKNAFLFTSLLLIFLINPKLQAQSTQAMYYLNYPRSMQGLGMGEQTVALRTSEDALNIQSGKFSFY